MCVCGGGGRHFPLDSSLERRSISNRFRSSWKAPKKYPFLPFSFFSLTQRTGRKNKHFSVTLQFSIFYFDWEEKNGVRPVRGSLERKNSSENWAFPLVFLNEAITG